MAKPTTDILTAVREGYAFDGPCVRCRHTGLRSDIKGDLAGLASPREPSDKIASRTDSVGQHWEPTAYPVELLRLGDAGTGVPVRATVTSFGPTPAGQGAQLTDTQESSLGLVFHYADKAGLPLLDLKDLRAVIQHLTSEEGKADLEELGVLPDPRLAWSSGH